MILSCLEDQGTGQVEDESQDVLIDVEVEADDMDHESARIAAQETSDGEDDGLHHHHHHTHHTGKKHGSTVNMNLLSFSFCRQITPLLLLTLTIYIETPPHCHLQGWLPCWNVYHHFIDF